MAKSSIYIKSDESTKRIVLNVGGVVSGKTYSLLQLMIDKAYNEKDKNILIIRKTLPMLKFSIRYNLDMILKDIEVYDKIKIDKANMIYTFLSSKIYLSNMNKNKLMSTEWNYIWVDEVTELDYSDFNLLLSRLRRKSSDGKRNQIFLSCNPIKECLWIKELLNQENVDVIYSNYKDNPYIAPEYVESLENYKNLDNEYYRIYTLGVY